MPLLNEIVDVEITRESRGVTQVGFNTPMILTTHSRFSERARRYSTLAAMVDDGFLTSDAAYKAANSLLAQENAPDEFLVGRATTPVAQIDTLTPDVSSQAIQHFIATIDGVVFDFTSDITPTAAEVVTGLNALINADATCLAAATGTTTTILTAKNAGAGFTTTVSANLTKVATTASNGPAEDIQLVDGTDNDWYALIYEGRSKALIMAAARYIETVEKIYVACSSDADVENDVTGNVAAALKAKSYDRTSLVYSGDQANYPEAAWVGARIAYDPGSATWKFVTLIGIDADALTNTQSSNIRNNNANTYEVFAGTSKMREGTVASGEFIDIIIGLDYLTQRIRENIFNRLSNSLKIPYTDAGVAIVQSLLDQSLADGVRKSILASYVITVPKVADVSTQDRADRLLPDVNFTGVLAGAIHKVEISGRVSV